MGRLAERFGLDLRLVLLILYSTPLTAGLFTLLMGANVALRGPAGGDVVGGIVAVFGFALMFAVMLLPFSLPGAAAGWVLGWRAAGRLWAGAICAWALWRNKGRADARGTV